MTATKTKEEVKTTTQEEATRFLQKMYLIELLMRSENISDDTKVSLNRYMVLYYRDNQIKDEKTRKYIINDVLSRLYDETENQFHRNPKLLYDKISYYTTAIQIIIEKDHGKWEYIPKNIAPIKMKTNILLDRELEVINA